MTAAHPAWDQIATAHAAVTNPPRGVNPALVRIAHRYGVVFEVVPPLDPDYHLCAHCPQDDIRPAVALIRRTVTATGNRHEQGTCWKFPCIATALFVPLLNGSFSALLIPHLPPVEGDPPLEHDRACLSWRGEPEDCDCHDDGPVHLADAPTVQAALVATFGSACDENFDEAIA